MTRVKRSVRTKARHKKILKLAKGYFGHKSKLFKVANQQVMKSLSYAYRDRRNKKREFRKLWITRINAAARMNGLSYSRFMNGLPRPDRPRPQGPGGHRRQGSGRFRNTLRPGQGCALISNIHKVIQV